MKYLHQLSKDKIFGKNCLLRINLDIKDQTKESSRIDAVLPTIKFLLERGVKILILSHRGRPEGADTKLSLNPLVDLLLKKLDLLFSRHSERSEESIFDYKDSSLSLRMTDCESICYLENLRFDPREQKNDDEFAKELAAKGDFYVNDDFATSHRASASLVSITNYLPSYAGLLLEKEIINLSRVMNNPERPLVMIIGGAKIDDKICAMKNFKDKADYFLMGSAYNGFQVSGFRFRDLENKIIFPEDFIEDGNGRKFDIGSKTIKKFSEIISQAKTIIWNGPVGMFEDARYLNGSQKIAEAIIASGAFSVVGGGDTDQLLNQLGLRDEFSFVSTGGGAMLEFLSGKKLPALEALEKSFLML